MNNQKIFIACASLLIFLAVVITSYGMQANAGEAEALKGNSQAQGGGCGPIPGSDNGVDPIVKGNVRYQPSAKDPGNLEGYDNSTSKRLWTVKIYNTPLDNPVHFKSMTEQADGIILIENQNGDRFIFDTANKYVSAE